MNIKDFLQLLNDDIEDSFGGDEWKDSPFSDEFFQNIKESFFPIGLEIDFLKSHLKPGSILDLGCGNFRLIEHLNDDFDCLGLDFSFHPLKSKKVPCLCADYSQLPIKKRFDNILLSFGQICFLQKEHLKTLLVQLKKHLKKGGLIYIDLPSPSNFQDLDNFNSFESCDNTSQFWVRQYFPHNDTFSQKQVIVDHQGKLISKLSLSYQVYALSELILLFQELGYTVPYNAENYENSTIKETSPWMIFLISKT
ncbi:MAG: class I SAM-dependent methyltransferase [Candidatus Cloacimonetes bacterium]|nr:class I SAM-dependent methyltransferase [Candidatus Cloacimonadota bacterium]